ncbi:hypothetical protein N9Z59_01800, partial [Akkermansiaceae bacterium]|nr:hypothetical protein [Akkermansiaceae bacterium]
LNYGLVKSEVDSGKETNKRSSSHDWKDPGGTANRDGPRQLVCANTLGELLQDRIYKPPLPPRVPVFPNLCHVIKAGLFGRV